MHEFTTCCDRRPGKRERTWKLEDWERRGGTVNYYTSCRLAVKRWIEMSRKTIATHLSYIIVLSLCTKFVYTFFPTKHTSLARALMRRSVLISHSLFSWKWRQFWIVVNCLHVASLCNVYYNGIDNDVRELEEEKNLALTVHQVRRNSRFHGQISLFSFGENSKFRLFMIKDYLCIFHDETQLTIKSWVHFFCNFPYCNSQCQVINWKLLSITSALEQFSKSP